MNAVDEGTCVVVDSAPCTIDRTPYRARPRYDVYISSAAWLRSPARLAELAAAGHRCRICDLGPPQVRLEVHHRTYVRLGCERPGDLTTLCSDCHRVATNELRARRYGAMNRPALTDFWLCDRSFEPTRSEWLDAGDH